MSTSDTKASLRRRIRQLHAEAESARKEWAETEDRLLARVRASVRPFDPLAGTYWSIYGKTWVVEDCSTEERVEMFDIHLTMKVVLARVDE